MRTEKIINPLLCAYQISGSYKTHMQIKQRFTYSIGPGGYHLQFVHQNNSFHHRLACVFTQNEALAVHVQDVTIKQTFVT